MGNLRWHVRYTLAIVGSLILLSWVLKECVRWMWNVVSLLRGIRSSYSSLPWCFHSVNGILFFPICFLLLLFFLVLEVCSFDLIHHTFWSFSLFWFLINRGVIFYFISNLNIWARHPFRKSQNQGALNKQAWLSSWTNPFIYCLFVFNFVGRNSEIFLKKV